jgi:sugar O-acyltransferase (sialic acid O-acetyltransferase NeuD family)
MHITDVGVWVMGHGGFAKEVKWLLDDTPGFFCQGFVDQADETEFHRTLATTNAHFYAAMGVGSPKLLGKIAREFSIYKNLKWPTIIHPSAIGDFDNITFGKGCVVCAGNVFTTDIHIGDFNVINLNSTLGHDLRTGAFCVINPNCSTSANTTLEGENLVGVGATILADRTMHTGAILGAGAVLTKDIPAGEIWAGVPAKRLGPSPNTEIRLGT